MSKVAIVILNWNGVDLLKRFLPSVIRYSDFEGVEVVVADNCSIDDSVRFVKENYPQISCVLSPENYGYAGGYNNALAQIDAEYYVLLNSDVEVTENWLQPIVHYLDENKDVAAAQPKMLWHREKGSFEYAGASGGYIDKYGYPFCRGRVFGKIEKDNGQYDDIANVLWASGACLFIRSKDFKQAGGFDAFFFAHMEEIDLCWRLNMYGRKVVAIPSSVVYHVGAATLSIESPRKTFLNFRNNLLMLYKNLPDDRLNKVMRMRLFLDYLAAFKYIFEGKYSNAKAVMNAHKEFSKSKERYNGFRQQSRGKEVESNIAVIYPRSILYDFYIRGRNIFSKLQWVR